MTEDEALELLQSMTAYDQHPVLTEEEVELILAGARLVDTYGVLPTEDDWTPTYNLNMAARKAWLMKAGKAASDFTYSDGGDNRNLSDVIKHCHLMAQEYGRGAGQTVGMLTSRYGGVTPSNAD